MSTEEMARHHKWLDEMDGKTKEIVAITPNSISTNDLAKYLKDINVVCDGSVMKVTSIVCTDPETKSRWMPVNMQGWDK